MSPAAALRRQGSRRRLFFFFFLTPGGGTAWWHETAGGPRRVEGGIRARSKRGAIGETWWSRRFIDVLESYGLSGRLSAAAATPGPGRCLTSN